MLAYIDFCRKGIKQKSEKSTQKEFDTQRITGKLGETKSRKIYKMIYEYVFHVIQSIYHRILTKDFALNNVTTVGNILQKKIRRL